MPTTPIRVTRGGLRVYEAILAKAGGVGVEFVGTVRLDMDHAHVCREILRLVDTGAIEAAPAQPGARRCGRRFKVLMPRESLVVVDRAAPGTSPRTLRRRAKQASLEAQARKAASRSKPATDDQGVDGQTADDISFRKRLRKGTEAFSQRWAQVFRGMRASYGGPVHGKVLRSMAKDGERLVQAVKEQSHG